MTNSELSVLDSAETRCLLDSLPDPAFLLDREFRIRSVNRAYQSLFADGNAVLGCHCYEVHHHQLAPCEPTGHGCPILDSARRRRSARCLHVHRSPEGEEHQHVSVYPIRRGDGVLVGFLQTFRVFTAASPVPHPKRLVGRSTAFNRMLNLIRGAAASEIPVLISGEPGAGKRRAGEAIHRVSARRKGPFAILDCASFGKPGEGSGLPETRPRSAAVPRAPWLAGVGGARGGTLLLNEVGDLLPSLQYELWELLENGSFRHGRRADDFGDELRLICTSTRDLRSLVASGAFRADLYSRISVFPIGVPPLRERLEDLPLLIDSLLRRLVGDRPQDLAPEALELLGAHDFPGNIRELLGILERASALAEGDTILPEHLQDAWAPPDGLSARLLPGSEIVPLVEIERRYLDWAVRNFDGDKAALAKRLGIAERTLYRKLRELRSEVAEPPR